MPPLLCPLCVSWVLGVGCVLTDTQQAAETPSVSVLHHVCLCVCSLAVGGSLSMCVRVCVERERGSDPTCLRT